MNRKRWWLVIALVLAGSGAFAALAAGQKIFVKAKNTRVLQKPDLASANVETLQPGEQVVWQQKEGEHFHQVLTPRGKKGYVYFANLSTKPVTLEYLRKDGDKPVDPKSFATSGAATKALAPGPIAYGEQKLDPKLGPIAVANVVALENLARSVTDDELRAFSEKRGLTLPLMASGAKAAK